MNMKRIAWGLAVAVCSSAQQAPAQEKKKEQPDPKQLQEAFEKFAKPGKEHKHLRRLVGRWDTTIKSFYPDPTKPTTSKGKARFRMLLGGRFVQQNFRGIMEGKPFRGIGLSGYDNAKKKYVGTWVDDMGTGIMTTEGKYDPKTQTLTETGTSSSPLGEMKFKMVSRYQSDDKFTFTMYMVAEAGEQKMMEITYTRAEEGKRKGKKADKE